MLWVQYLLIVTDIVGQSQYSDDRVEHVHHSSGSGRRLWWGKILYLFGGYQVRTT